MAIVPLGLKAYQRTSAFTPEVRLVNLYVEKDESGVSPDGTLRIQRPGLVADTSFSGTVRALHNFNGRRLTVAGGGLFDGTFSVASVAGQGIAPITSTAFHAAVLGDGKVTLYDTASTEVVMPDGRLVQDVDQVNGYILTLCPDGRFYWIVPGETTVDALNFATAESSPDAGVAIRRLVDEFWIFGTEITEVWQTTGDVDSPFQRVAGRQYERGCLARDTVRRFDNSLLWVGDDCNVYRGGAVPQVISDNGIAERVRKRSGAPSAWVFSIDGHKFYVLRIPGQGTFAFDAATSGWCEFASLGQIGWRPHVGFEVGGVSYAGSVDSGEVWRIDAEVGTDAGTAIERIVTATTPVLGKPPRNDSVTIGVGASADCTVQLRWKDGQDDFPAFYEDLDVLAPLDLATIYRLGQPDQPYRTWEVRITDPARVRISGMVAGDAWK